MTRPWTFPRRWERTHERARAAGHPGLEHEPALVVRSRAVTRGPAAVAGRPERRDLDPRRRAPLGVQDPARDLGGAGATADAARQRDDRRPHSACDTRPHGALLRLVGRPWREDASEGRPVGRPSLDRRLDHGGRSGERRDVEAGQAVGGR